jgi:hypothetical protein
LSINVLIIFNNSSSLEINEEPLSLTSFSIFSPFKPLAKISLACFDEILFSATALIKIDKGFAVISKF